MTGYADYHIHSKYSPDAKPEITAVLAAARAAGLTEICLTEHVDLHHPNAQFSGIPNFDKWMSDIAQAQVSFPDITLRMGLEIGDIAAHRQETLAFIDSLPLDFRLLSLHVVDGLDPYDPGFFDGRSQTAAYRRYVELKLESVMHFGDFDALAHLGYCGKFAPFAPEECPLRHHHAPDHLDMLLRSLAQQGKALELNTSGLRRIGSLIPGEDILRRFAQLGGEFVTLGSDAHEAQHVGYGFAQAAALAKSAGLRWGLTFNARRPQPFAL